MGQPLDGPLIKQYRDLAQKYSVWLSLGGFKESSEEKVRVYSNFFFTPYCASFKKQYRLKQF